MDPVEEMLIERACERVVALYAEAVNRKDIDAFVNLFTTDAVWQRPAVPAMNGHGEIRAFMESQPKGRVLRHVNGHAIITVKGPDSASGISTTTVYDWIADHPLPAPLSKPDMVVEYFDQYVKTPEGWRIARRDTFQVFSQVVNY